MSVDCTKVAGRREIHFETLDDVVADAKELVSSPTARTLGNWTLTKLLSHLAQTIDNSIDGFQMKAPLIIRMIGPFIERSALRKVSPGIKLPKKLEPIAFPEAPSVQSAPEDLVKAVAQTKTERMESKHPAFGRMSHEDCTALHLRHSEMHLSFAVPE